MQQQQQHGDIVENLPTDQQEPSPHETQLFDTVFTQKKTIFDTIMGESKNILLLGALYILLSLPPLDNLLKRYIPLLESPYMLVGFKAVLLMVIYFVVVNIYLVRK